MSVQGPGTLSYYSPALFSSGTAGTGTVSRERKVDPPPKLPSKPDLSRQFGDQPKAEDYVVYLPAKKDAAETGPTYSNLNPAKPQKAREPSKSKSDSESAAPKPAEAPSENARPTPEPAVAG